MLTNSNATADSNNEPPEFWEPNQNLTLPKKKLLQHHVSYVCRCQKKKRVRSCLPLPRKMRNSFPHLWQQHG